MTKERRRATNCELIGPAEKAEGYYRYLVTIREIDGKEHKVPAYGVDMQDAIKKLVMDEFTTKVKKVYVNKIEPLVVILAIVGWLGCVTVSAITANYQYAYYAVIGIMTLFTGYAIIQNLKNK